MFEKFYEDLQLKLDSIAAGTPAAVPDWRSTPIKGWENGFAGEAQAIREKEWWAKPRESAGQALNELLHKAGLGELKTSDGKEEEGRQFHPGGEAHGTTVEEVVEGQHKKEQAGVEDEGEEWRTYLPNGADSLWSWCDQLPVEINITAQSQPWYDSLRSYIHKFPRGTRASASGVDSVTIEKLVRAICESAHQEVEN